MPGKVAIPVYLPLPYTGLYLAGHGDAVSRLNMRITAVIVWLIGVIHLLTTLNLQP